MCIRTPSAAVSRFFSSVACLALLGWGASSTAAAAIVYQNDFENSANRAKGVGGLIDQTGPDGSWAAHQSDGSTTGQSAAAAVILFSDPAIAAFDTTQPGQQTLIIEADYALTSVGNNGTVTNSIPRLRLQHPSDANSDIFVLFGRNSAGDMVLAASKGNNPSPSTAGTMVLFNYGAYDGTTATNNDTGGHVHITITYEDQANTIAISATQNAVTQSATLTGVVPTSYNDSLSKSFGAITANTTTSESYLDNIVIQVVPEPSAAGLIWGGLTLTTRRRRA